MAKKQIKWGNKELPNVSFDELNKLTSRVLSANERGKENVASGHLLKISASKTDKKQKAAKKNGLKGLSIANSAPEDVLFNRRSKGGKTSGNNAKESGQFYDYLNKGTKAAVANKLEQTKGYIQKLYDLITLKQFTTNDVKPLYTHFDHLKDGQMIGIWIRDTRFFECIGKKGNSKIYIKIKNNGTT